MTRTQLEHVQLLQDSSEIARTVGQCMFGMGSHVAHIAIMPKQAAQDLLKTAEQLEEIRSKVLDLANKVIDWEQSAITAGVRKGLVDSDGRAL